jgi:hypothetical protein
MRPDRILLTGIGMLALGLSLVPTAQAQEGREERGRMERRDEGQGIERRDERDGGERERRGVERPDERRDRDERAVHRGGEERREREALRWRLERGRGWRFEQRPGLWSPYYVWWWLDQQVVLRPAPTETVIRYPNGRYELRGDGVSVPYYWAWIPVQVATAPPPPPAPPAGVAPDGTLPGPPPPPPSGG